MLRGPNISQSNLLRSYLLFDTRTQNTSEGNSSWVNLVESPNPRRTFDTTNKCRYSLDLGEQWVRLVYVLGMWGFWSLIIPFKGYSADDSLTRSMQVSKINRCWLLSGRETLLMTLHSQLQMDSPLRHHLVVLALLLSLAGFDVCNGGLRLSSSGEPPAPHSHWMYMLQGCNKDCLKVNEAIPHKLWLINFIPVDREFRDRECLGFLTPLVVRETSLYIHRLWYTRTYIDVGVYSFDSSIANRVMYFVREVNTIRFRTYCMSLVLLKDSQCIRLLWCCGYLQTPIMSTTEGSVSFDEFHILELMMDLPSEPLI